MQTKLKSYILAICALLFTICLLIMPNETLMASKRGLDIWTSSVFPSLLPFLIIGELLIGFGVVHFIGVLFEPIMRPIFNLPGISSFVLVMGMASGFPAGAKFTAQMRSEGQLSKVEAERLVSFSNAANPLFIIAVIAVTFFKEPSIGLILLIAHYGSNLLVGLVMRFYKKDRKLQLKNKKDKSIWLSALDKLHETRISNHKPFGQLFGDAVINSIQTLTMIGGFIIFFSVFSTILIETNILARISQMIGVFFPLFNLPQSLALPFATGIFELTIGAEQIANSLRGSLMAKTILMSVLLAFNGLSIHAQVSSILSKTDIKYSAYFRGRIIQAFFSVGIVLFLYPKLIESSHVPLLDAIPVQGITTSYVSQFMLNLFGQYGIVISLLSLWIGFSIYSYRLFKTNKHLP